MTKVAILPVPTDEGVVSYRAVAGDKHSQGSTVGAALDALTPQLTMDEAGTLIIVQSLRPDRFFSAAQQKRLAELMDRWRTARDQGNVLPQDEQSELETLVEAELRAAAGRAAVLGEESAR
jgi:hypothetical protein